MDMNRFSLIAAFLLMLGLAAPMGAQAQTNVKIGPRVGVPVGDVSDVGGTLFVGGEARVGTSAFPVVINPSFDFYLTDVEGTSIFTVDLNGLYEFGDSNQAFTPYVGGGIAITRFSQEVRNPVTGTTTSTSSTDLGLNVVGGARFLVDPVEPFVQVNAAFGGDLTRLGITGGLLFSL